ncbi:MAG: hypothetical protein ACRCXA_02515 [Peptostreptococcaceae bacterium]
MKPKYIIISIFIMLMVFIINCIPMIFPKVPIIITVINILPMYIITRKNPSAGLITYVGVFLLTILSYYDMAIIFLFINGLIGIFIGMFNHYTENKYIISLFSGLALTLGVNGICSIKFSFVYLIDIEMYILSVILCFIILLGCNYMYNKIINIKLRDSLIE